MGFIPGNTYGSRIGGARYSKYFIYIYLIIIMYIYHALINALSIHMIHVY